MQHDVMYVGFDARRQHDDAVAHRHLTRFDAPKVAAILAMLAHFCAPDQLHRKAQIAACALRCVTRFKMFKQRLAVIPIEPLSARDDHVARKC